ncbi:MAG: DUF952 domain-containing protein [Paracoccaceae bacterium]
MLIYKILTTEQWTDLERLGETRGAPVDMADGFIHFSTAAQIEETATKHFSGQSGLWLAAFDADAMGAALKWEPSRGGALFPHLYAPLRSTDVLWIHEMPLGPDGHQFPDEVT